MAGALGFLGGGSQADEAAEFTELAIAFRAIDSTGQLPAGFIDIRTTDEALLATPVVAAVGAPGLRRRLIEQWGGTHFTSIVSSAAWVSPSAIIGEGSIVAPGAVVTTGVVLGSHVILNVGASVSHASIVGDFATISPGVRIAGSCRIGAGTFIGIGASISHGVDIAPGSVIGAGSTVLADVTQPGVWVGSPARLVRAAPEWIMSL